MKNCLTRPFASVPSCFAAVITLPSVPWMSTIIIQTSPDSPSVSVSQVESLTVLLSVTSRTVAETSTCWRETGTSLTRPPYSPLM